MRLVSRTVSNIATLFMMMVLVVSMVFAEGLLGASANSAMAADNQFTVTFVKENGEVDTTRAISDFTLTSDSTTGAVSGFPTYEYHTFMRAYVGDQKNTKKQMEISGAKLDGDKVVITPKETQDGNASTTLYYPLAESTKIYLQYFENAKFAELTFNKPDDVILSAETKVGLTSGKGTTVFVVAADRSKDLSVSVSSGGATQKGRTDFSTNDRTVIQYTFEITQNTTFTVSATNKPAFHTLTFNTESKTDWAQDNQCSYASTGQYAHCNHIYQVNGRNISVDDKLTNTETVADNTTKVFTVYHDRGYFGGEGITAQLTGLWIGGRIFAAPQPLSRYGASMYSTLSSWVDAPNYNNINKQSGKAHHYAFETDADSQLSWLIPVFAKSQGYDAYHYPYSYQSELTKWYINAIQKRVIGATTEETVESGPLAGSTITIEVLDAKTMMHKTELGKPATSYNSTEFSEQNDRNWNTGGGNTLRLAYKVTITNVRTDLVIEPEWVRSTTLKVGNYLNRGVDTMQVWASLVGYNSNAHNIAKKWNEVGSSGGYFDVLALENTTHVGNYKTWPQVYNLDPIFKFKATLKNGYTNPTYRDATWSHVHKGEWWKQRATAMTLKNDKYYDPHLAVTKNNEGVGGEFPLFAVTQIERWNNGYSQGVNNFIGGQNIVGVDSKPAKVIGYFDLDGGSVPEENKRLFPSASEASSNIQYQYDVESNRVIRIPIQRPTKGGQPLVAWELHRVSPAPSGASAATDARVATVAATINGDRSANGDRASNNATATTLPNGATDTTVGFYQPGEQIDLRSATEMGSRITAVNGDVLVDKFYFKAIYSSSADVASQTRTIKLVDKTNDANTVLQETVFNAITGVMATLDKTAAPEVLEKDNKVYVRRTRDLSNELSTAVTDTNETFVFEYEEAKDVIPVTGPNSGITKPDGYIEVTFIAGANGNISGTTKYYVRSGINKKLGDIEIVKPSTTANEGYEFSNWTPGNDTTIGTTDVTVTANFRPKKDVYYKGEAGIENQPEGYVTVEFKIDSEKGSFGTTDKTTYFVRKEANKTVSELTKPTVTPKTGYKWENKWSVEDTQVISENLTINATLDTWPDIDTSQHDGYVKIEFSPGANGSFDSTAIKEFWVNPGKNKTFRDLPSTKPVAKPSVGYQFAKWTSADVDVNDTTVLNKAMTITANYTQLADVIEANDAGSNKPEGYWTITFAEGSHGSFAAGAKKVFYVKPDSGVTLAGISNRPTANPHVGYSFTKWTSNGTEVTDSTALDKADWTITAEYTYLGDIIPLTGDTAAPTGYWTVTYTAERDKGTLSEPYKFAVNPKGIKLKDVTKPTVTNQIGYRHNGWGTDGETVVSSDMTVAATFEKLPDFKPKSDTETIPEGYVTLTFDPTDKGTVPTGSTTVYWVNPRANVQFSRISAPTVTANTGYEFKGWNADDGTALQPTTVINKTMTATGRYDAYQDIETMDRPGYVRVEFTLEKANNEGSFATGAVTTYWVNPLKGKTLANITKPAVNLTTGFVFAGWDQPETTPIDTTLVTTGLTVTGSFKALPDQIEKSESQNDPPAGYVTVTFSVDDTRGTLSGATTVFVNPGKLTFEQINKPTVSDKTGYYFTNTWQNTADSSTISGATTVASNLNAKAVHNAYPHVDEETHPGYVKVEYVVPQGQGTMNGQAVFYVNPEATVKLSEIQNRPTVTAAIGYDFTAWDHADNTEVTTALTVTATMKKYDDIIPVDPKADPAIEKPHDYATVTFAAGENGTILDGETVTYYVNPLAGKKLKDLKKPATQPNQGYKFGSWDKDDETDLNRDVSVTGSFVPAKDIIPKGEDGFVTPPDNYVTVRFAAGVHGRLQEGDVTTYFVNPFASVMFADLAEPGVVADGGYQFTHWVTVLRKAGSAAVSGAGGAVGGSADFDLADALDDSVDDAEAEPVWLGLSGNERITSDLMVVASFEGLPAVIPVTDPDLKRPSGYVTVEFTAGSHGSFEEGTLTRFFVNPDAGVLVENLPEAFVEADDGYRFTHWAVYYAKTTAAAEAGAESDSSDADDDTSGTSDSGSADSSSSSSDSSGLSDDSDGDSYADSVSSTGDGSAFSLVGLSGNEVVDDHVTLVAQYEALPNVIVVEDGLERPNGYVTVRFESGLHGSLSGMSEFYVKLAARLRVSDLAEPFVEPQTGFVFANWTRGDAEFDLDTVIGEDLVLVAAYTALPDVIPVLPGEGGDLPVRPAGYVTVTFVAGEHGVLAEGAPSKFFVNPTVNVTFSALSGKAPEVLPSTGFLFAAWTDEGKTVEPTLVINADKTFVASYSSIEDVVELTGDVDKPEGYVTVTFVVDPARATATGTLLYAVNPTKNVMLAKVPHPTVNAKTGFVHSGWDKADDFTVTADVTVNATFTQLDPVIPASDTTPNPPAGYVTVTFVVDPLLGDVAEGFQLVYFVDPTREVSLADLTKPEVSPLVDYRFLGWDKDDALRLVEDTTVTALFELTDAGEFEPEGQPIRVTEGTTPKAEDGVANRGELPEESVYSFKGELPVLPGSYEVTVVVTYPDGTVDEVEVTLIIDPAPKLTRIAKTGVASLPLMAAGVLFALVAGVFLTLRRNHEQ